jgi:hypothetical protein
MLEFLAARCKHLENKHSFEFDRNLSIFDLKIHYRVHTQSSDNQGNWTSFLILSSFTSQFNLWDRLFNEDCCVKLEQWFIVVYIVLKSQGSIQDITFSILIECHNKKSGNNIFNILE